MAMQKTLTGFVLLLTMGLVSSLRAQSPSPQKDEGSCRRFVLEFYDWYAANIDSPGDLLERVLKLRRFAFSPELVRALREYLRIPPSPEGYINTLDFDPFVNAQDNAYQYVIGNVSRKDGNYWVEVYGIWSGKKGAQPDVVPEVTFQDGHWMFVNFHYVRGVGGTDMLSMLKQVVDRQKQAISKH